MLDLITTKKIWLFLLILGAFAIASLFTLIVYPEFQDLVVFFFYLIASNTFLGIPHEPLLIYYGKLYPVYIPVLVAIIPTILGTYIDYAVLTPILRSRYLERFRQQTIYLKAVRYFKKFPFLTLMIFAISPIPFWPVRILSVSTRYPYPRFATAVTLGRIPRYTLLALGGMTLNIPDWLILTIFIVMISLPFIPKLISMVKNRIGNIRGRLRDEGEQTASLNV